MSDPIIDWSKIAEQTITCVCDHVYRSKAKGKITPDTDPKFTIFVERPCPACGRDRNPRRTSSDPESFTVRGQ